jgi:secreted Zn-dependent insulinase-like peptidase
MTIEIICFSDLVQKILSSLLSNFNNTQQDVRIYNQALIQLNNKIQEELNQKLILKAEMLFLKLIKYNITLSSELSPLLTKDFLNFEEFKMKSAEILSNIGIYTLLYGAINKESLKPITDTLLTITLKSNKPFNYEFTNMLNTHKKIEGSIILRIKNDNPNQTTNNVILNSFQIGHFDQRNALMLKLMEITWSSVLVNYLKIQKHIGKLIYASSKIIDSYLYFQIMIQSSIYTPKEINQEIDTALFLCRQELEKITKKSFEEYKQIIKDDFNKEDENLYQRADKTWKEISQATFNFRKSSFIFEQLDNIFISDLIEMFEQIFLHPRKLSIQIYKNTEIIPENSIEDYPLNFKIKSNIFHNLTEIFKNPVPMEEIFPIQRKLRKKRFDKNLMLKKY